MPSSDPVTIPHVLKLVSALNPRSILDVGSGNGRYGFLFREVLDLNHGRLPKTTWKTRIDSVEVDKSYLTDVHRYVYDKVFNIDWREFETSSTYDLVFMGDVLEHFDDWQFALEKAISMSWNVMVVSPNWNGSINQGAWHGHDHETHRVELSPEMVGGKCVFANSKCFISCFGGGVFDQRDILL